MSGYSIELAETKVELEQLRAKYNNDLERWLTVEALLTKSNTEIEQAKAELADKEHDFTKMSDLEHDAVCKLTAERERAKGLVDFIEAWLTFESDCIEKDGPYVSKSIPNLMTAAREALLKYKGEGT